jgi:hypothetical protein
MKPPDHILPHADFGAPECCGLLLPNERGEVADIICNECGAIVQTVPASDLSLILDQMQLKLDVATERCPYCRSVNLLPGFSKTFAFTCRSCGRAVAVEAP